MISMDKLFAINRAACEALSVPLAAGPAVSCTRSFTILPLRYAAVGGNSGLRERLPQLPDNLHHAHQAGALTQAAYAIRPLREGFLYVMEARRIGNRLLFLDPFRISADGSLAISSFDDPWQAPPASLTAQDVTRNLAWALTIHDVDDLIGLRLFYSPDPLSRATLMRLFHQASSVPAVNVAKYAVPSCSVPESHVLTYGQLDLVADFAAENDPDLRKMLDAQLSSTPKIMSLVASRQMLKPKPNSDTPRGIAIVVEDAIGITQDLNAWRNTGLEHLKGWLETTTPGAEPEQPGISNERKVLVAQAFTQLHAEFSERKVGALLSRHTQSLREYLTDGEQSLPPGPTREWWAHTREGILEVDAQFKRKDLEARAATGEFAKAFEERYLPRVDLPAMHVQLGWFETVSREAQRQADARAGDHLMWLQHPRLLAALDLYDQEDLTSGLCFAHQTGLCVLGMEGTVKGAQLLSRWWQSGEVEASNLAMRAYVFNQKSVAEVLAKTQSDMRILHGPADDWQKLETALQQAKALAAQFSAIDGHLERLAQHGHVNTAGALAWIGHLGREALSAGAPNAVDRALHRRLVTLLTASLGEQALNLRMAEHAQVGHTPSPGRVAAPIMRRLDQAYVDSLNGAHSNSFYRLRVSSALLLLEASLLLLQGRREDKDRRFWSEVAAGALTSAAAGMELLAVGTEQALASLERRSASARGASISLGRYRVWGAAMASAGGAVSIAWDINDALSAGANYRDTRDLKKGMLAGAYSTRAFATFILLSGQGGIAFSQAGAYFRWLALNASSKHISGPAKLLAAFSKTLAGNRALLLLLSRMGWIGGVVAIGMTFTLLVIDENELEKWCEKCCFSRSKNTKFYELDQEELASFINAVSETL
ncbi:T6SS effector BTH_I2691 family protein [Pseudomonas sp.]|uniref:T6SS effector BTH_I2691 family protein n=1 Tax=Pseudomonas sp. TaxID=306 RepID=UPI00289E8DBF|nr:T6SS effector BTH_I2691 family protein [Pseudomonas sp.]